MLVTMCDAGIVRPFLEVHARKAAPVIYNHLDRERPCMASSVMTVDDTTLDILAGDWCIYQLRARACYAL